MAIYYFETNPLIQETGPRVIVNLGPTPYSEGPVPCCGARFWGVPHIYITGPLAVGYSVWSDLTIQYIILKSLDPMVAAYQGKLSITLQPEKGMPAVSSLSGRAGGPTGEQGD